MTLTWQKIENIEQLKQLSPQWSTLNQQTNNDCLFTSPNWLIPWYETFWQQSWRLHCFAVYSKEKLIALLPFYFQNNVLLLKEKKLFLLGQGEPERSEVASEYIDVLVDPFFIQAIKSSYQDHLNLHKFDNLTIRAIEENANLKQIFKFQYQSIGYQYIIKKTNWNITQLSKNSLNRYKRSMNQLSKLNSQFLWVEADEYLHCWEAMKIYHQQRWKNKNKPGAFAEPNFNQLHQTLISNHPKNIKMSVLKIDNEIAAINYYLVSNNTLHFYQSGWNETEYKKLSPGFALHLWSIEHTEFPHYDFMLGSINDSYKQRFKTDTPKLFSASMNNKPFKAFLLKVLRKLKTV